jgi:hypothetical protein
MPRGRVCVQLQRSQRNHQHTFSEFRGCSFLRRSVVFIYSATPCLTRFLGDNGTLTFWDYNTGTAFQNLDDIPQPGSLEAEAGVFCSTYDITGTRLITGGADKTIKVGCCHSFTRIATEIIARYMPSNLASTDVPLLPKYYSCPRGLLMSTLRCESFKDIVDTDMPRTSCTIPFGDRIVTNLYVTSLVDTPLIRTCQQTFHSCQRSETNAIHCLLYINSIRLK